MAVTLEINWDVHNNLKITDVHEKTREKVYNFILEHFRSYELFKILKIPEEPGIEKEFKFVFKHLIENDCSIIVVDQENGDIQAVALLKWMSSKWRSWTAIRLLIDSERFKELCEMVRSCLEQHAISINLPDWDSLHIFSYYIHEDLEGDECFMARFFNAICEVARHMHMPRVTYMCLDRKHREVIEEAEFVEIVRVIYSMYMYKGRRPFDRLRDLNEMYGGLYEKQVQPIIPFNEMLIRHEQPIESKDAKKKKEEVVKKAPEKPVETDADDN